MKKFENEVETILIKKPIDLKAQIVNNIEDLIPTPTKFYEVFVPLEEVKKEENEKYMSIDYVGVCLCK